MSAKCPICDLYIPGSNWMYSQHVNTCMKRQHEATKFEKNRTVNRDDHSQWHHANLLENYRTAMAAIARIKTHVENTFGMSGTDVEPCIDVEAKAICDAISNGYDNSCYKDDEIEQLRNKLHAAEALVAKRNLTIKRMVLGRKGWRRKDK